MAYAPDMPQDMDAGFDYERYGERGLAESEQNASAKAESSLPYDAEDFYDTMDTEAILSDEEDTEDGYDDYEFMPDINADIYVNE